MTGQRRTTFQVSVSAIFALMVALLTPSAHAEINEEALFEVSLGAGVSAPSGDLTDYPFNGQVLQPATGLHVHASGGYFFTAMLSAGLALEYDQHSMDAPAEAQHFRFYTASLYGKYHFSDESKVTPYIRGNVGLTFPNLTTPLLNTPGSSFREDNYDPILNLGVGLGARISTNTWSGLFLEVGYRFLGLSNSEASFEGQRYVLPLDGAEINVTAGVAFDIGPSS